MYKTSYVCDCCGKEMTLPMYTLNLSTNAQNFCIQDQVTWHYCSDCWDKIKDQLTGCKSENDEKINKEIDRLKEENELLQSSVDWWNSIFILLVNNAIKQEKEKEKDTKLVTCNCYCEDIINKERYLNFKKTMGMI